MISSVGFFEQFLNRKEISAMNAGHTLAQGPHLPRLAACHSHFSLFPRETLPGASHAGALFR